MADLQAGTILYTRDSHRFGNAIIKCKCPTSIEFYEVVTDFGNTLKLERHEIEDRYEIGPVRSYTGWVGDSYRLHDALYNLI